jgi:hypothetical protein
MLDGIGVTDFRRTFGGTGNPQTERFRYTLAYARVGGVAYGQPVASGSPYPGYLPLGVGDRWDYALFSGPPGAETPDGVASVTVTSITSETAVRRAVRLAVIQRSASGAETRGECGLFRVSLPAELTGGAGCSPPESIPNGFSLGVELGPSAFTIGGEEVTADQAYGATTVSQNLPSITVTTRRTTEAARGLGIVRWTFAETYSAPSPTPRYRSGRLVYARVNGVETGRQAVAGEDAPAEAQTLTLGPNPARTQTTLRFAAAERAAEAVVRDALGRVVLRVAVPSGASEATLDVSGLATGVYIVGIGAASGRLVVLH